jgi:NADH-quinone oxidoreductase subunit N
MILPTALFISLPELILGGGVLLLLLIGALRGDRAIDVVSWLAAAVLLAAAAAAAFGARGAAFNGGFVADDAAAFAKVVIDVFTVIAVVLGEGWLHRLESRRFEFPILMLIAALGMGMMVSSGNLISLFVGVELQSLALYVLCAFRRDDAKSSEAGLKYFVLGALSSGILLYGASLIYGFAGSVRFVDIAHAVQLHPSTGVIFGVVFLICGLAFKVSAAPFHMWTPDVYEGAPTPVVAFVAAAPKLAAMVLFARALLLEFPGAVDQWRQVVLVVAAVSMAVGAVGGLAQSNLKRLLAYSSILNIGYALMGLSAGAPQGVQAMLQFMVLYIIDVTGFFACFTALKRQGRSMETFQDMAGLIRESPGLGLALTGLSFSLMGMPPFAGFWAKFYVFKAALAEGQWGIAVFGLLTSVVAAVYYLRLVKAIWFDPSDGRVDAPAPEARAIGLTAAAISFPLVLPALGLLDLAATAAARSFGVV